MRIAVLGDGLLGACVSNVLGVEPVTRKDVNLTNALDVMRYMDNYDVIVNCVGITPHSPDYQSPLLRVINEKLPYWLSLTHKPLIHISTDCVFSGERGFYEETDTEDGWTSYALTKIMGDKALMLDNSTSLILRTSFVGLPDPKGRGLFAWAAQQEHIDGYRYVYWSGLTTLELAYRIKWFIDNDIFPGVLHLHGERVSKYELLTKANSVFGWGVEITPVDEPFNDKSLTSLYPEYQTDKSLDEMLKELEEYADGKSFK